MRFSHLTQAATFERLPQLIQSSRESAVGYKSAYTQRKEKLAAEAEARARQEQYRANIWERFAENGRKHAEAENNLTEEEKREKAKQEKEEKRLRKLKLRRERRQQWQEKELWALQHRLIGDTQQYCSDQAVVERREQKAKWLEWANKTAAFDGEHEVRLAEIIAKSGEKKKAELLAWTKGIQDYAKKLGWTWLFITLTAPPRFHSNPSKGQNSYDGSTPTDAKNWIMSGWRNARKRLDEAEILPVGLWVIEPHLDACPHAHFMLFADPLDTDKIEEIIRAQKAEWKIEAGCKIVKDDGRASPTSYLFPYLVKTLGAGIDADRNTMAADACRSGWGLRSHGFIGVPAKNVWRALRKIKETPNDPLLKEMKEKADQGDASGFFELQGGLGIRKKYRPVKLLKDDREIEEKDESGANKITFEVAETPKTFWLKRWQLGAFLGEPAKGFRTLTPNYPRNPPPLHIDDEHDFTFSQTDEYNSETITRYHIAAPPAPPPTLH